MRYCQIFLVSLSIALLLFLAGDTLSVAAHGQSGNCQWHYVRPGETLSGIARMYQTPSYQDSGSSAPGYQAPAYQAPGYAPAPTPSQPDQMVVVRVDDFAFIPRTVKIQAGQTVVWKRARGTHSVRADDGSFGNEPGNTWTEFSHTFTAAGTFPKGVY
jgi:plastocyanin